MHIDLLEMVSRRFSKIPCQKIQLSLDQKDNFLIINLQSQGQPPNSSFYFSPLSEIDVTNRRSTESKTHERRRQVNTRMAAQELEIIYNGNVGLKYPQWLRVS